MRTFGTETDKLIDLELEYGTNNYQILWFQNGLQRDIDVSKAVIHFVGAKYPLGNVTIDYLELNTKYLDFLEEDAISLDIMEDDSTLTVGTYYVGPEFTKNKYDASYTAYSSLVDLGLKLNAWEGASESATIGCIVHHFIDELSIVFDTEPESTLTFNAAMVDFSAITLGELLGWCACIEQCNYVLHGAVLKKVIPSAGITKEYNMDDVVYSENLSQTASDAGLDYIKINYKTVSMDIDEDGQITYGFNDASYICKTGTESCGFELNIGLVPESESAMQSYFSAYFNSVKGMDCNGYNVSFLGDARVEVGDKLKFYNNNSSAVLNVAELIWEWDGALKCTVSTGSNSNTNTGSGFSIQQVVSQIQAMTNSVKNVQYNAVYANELYAKVAELGFASIGQLKADVALLGYARIEDMVAATARISILESNSVTTSYLESNYAKMDFANITDGALEKLYANTGILTDVTIKDGAVTGTLNSVKVNADLITVGTLSVDRLLVTGKDSIVYQINADSSGLSKTELSKEIYQKYLNGTDIVANSITAAQIKAGTITSNELNVDNIFGNIAVLNKITSAEAFINAINTNSVVVGASKNASDALSAANTASTNASSAVSKADTAIGTANSASTNASSAVSKADTAIGTANSASTNATSALNRATYHYGTCDTAAGTAAKAAALSNFSLYTGAIVSVKFANANTAASPTLNVNSTGAKPIYANNAAIAKQYYWKAQDTVTFIYNGTQWVMAETSARTILAGWCYNNDLTYINGGNIYTGTITANAIASNAVTAAKISSGAVTADKIASNAITAEKISSGAITTDKLVANAVTAAKINVSDLFAQNITATGSITGAKLYGTYIESGSGKIGGLNIGTSKLYTDRFLLEQKANGVDLVVKDNDSSELFSIKTSHPANSAMWNAMNIKNFSEVNISADDIYVYGGAVNINNVSFNGGNIDVYHKDSSESQVNVRNNIRGGRLVASGSGRFGLYDTTAGKWVVRTEGNDFTQIDRSLIINGLGSGTSYGQVVMDWNTSRVFLRNDGADFYILLGSADGGFNSKRPFRINISTGYVYLSRGTNVVSTYGNCCINTSNGLISAATGSSKRYKHEISTVIKEELNPRKLYNVDVFQYKFKKEYLKNKDDQRYDKDVIGLIAEKVYEHYPVAADYEVGDDGKVTVKDWNYRYLVPAMLKLIQEQHKRITKLEKADLLKRRG